MRYFCFVSECWELRPKIPTLVPHDEFLATRLAELVNFYSVSYTINFFTNDS